MKFINFLFLIFILSYQPSQAQSIGSFRPDGISGSAGFGFTTFYAKAPQSQRVNFDKGNSISIQAEKGMGAMNLFVTFSLAYLTTEGEAFYKYTRVGPTNYNSAIAIDFDTKLFQAGLGLRWKLSSSYWIRPYVEGGGVGGLFNIDWNSQQLRAETFVDENYKADDSILDLGTYYEAGMEFEFSKQFGVRVAARFTDNETKEFETFDNKKLLYNSETYYLALLKAF